MSTTEIRFVRRPAVQGWHWLQLAFAMFRRYWLTWMLLLIAYMVLMLFVRAIPVIGVLIFMVLKPVFGVGFLAAAWSQERGQQPKLSQLFAGFQSNLYALIPLGVAYCVGIILALLATALVDQGIMVKALFYGESPPDDYWSGTQLQYAMMMAVVCAVPVLLALWFSPALVVFGDAGPITALSTSFRAAMNNWPALLVYVLVLMLLSGVLRGFLAMFTALWDDKNGFALWVLASTPIWMIISVTMLISDYVSYRDVFHAEEAGMGDEG